MSSLGRANTMENTIQDSEAYLEQNPILNAQRVPKKIERYEPEEIKKSPTRKTRSKSPVRKKGKSKSPKKATYKKKTLTRTSRSPARTKKKPKKVSSGLKKKKVTKSTFYSKVKKISGGNSCTNKISVERKNEIDEMKKNRLFPVSTGVDERLTEIVFSFDSTGSMGQSLQIAKKNIEDIVGRLFDRLQNVPLKIGIINHGDYCGYPHNYFQHIDLTDNADELTTWIKQTRSLSGGDADEHYEYVLEFVNEKISWTPGSHRVLVLIGDEGPHDPSTVFSQMKSYRVPNPREICWKEEAEKCYTNGIKIYGVQARCLNNDLSVKKNYFYKSIAARTCGVHVKLENFNVLTDMILMVCYREGQNRVQLEKYKNEMALGGRLDAERKALYNDLDDSLSKDEAARAAILAEEDVDDDEENKKEEMEDE
eukprot:TRINITY_DN2996_c0_g1_i1.p1 TRINITY_DN2996_c0_g1~~TRINITY_DN2996_c0_g1_i1.p1  ORF type:complete len:424 (+),score=159.09 TRINITY_DN2996_c0_g1_i1:402-1673(+)